MRAGHRPRRVAADGSSLPTGTRRASRRRVSLTDSLHPTHKRPDRGLEGAEERDERLHVHARVWWATADAQALSLRSLALFEPDREGASGPQFGLANPHCGVSSVSRLEFEPVSMGFVPGWEPSTLNAWGNIVARKLHWLTYTFSVSGESALLDDTCPLCHATHQDPKTSTDAGEGRAVGSREGT